MKFIDIYNENHKYLGTCEKELAHKNCKWTLTKKENNIERDKKILEILAKLSVDKISWTWEEVLLYSNFIELLDSVK